MMENELLKIGELTDRTGQTAEVAVGGLALG